MSKQNIIRYTSSFEKLLKEEAEKAEVMAILHNNSYIKYNKLSVMTNIPVIILSAIVGFLSPINIFPDQNIFLGALSVSSGIIKTLDNYMDFTKRSQSHYMTGLSYKKISKFIQIQLSLDKSCRILPDDLLTMITNDMENIANSEPSIPEDIIIKFNQKYNQDRDTEKYKTSKPAIVNGLTEVQINQSQKISFDDIKDTISIQTKHDVNIDCNNEEKVIINIPDTKTNKNEKKKIFRM